MRAERKVPYSIVPTLDKAMRIVEGAQSERRVSYELPSKESASSPWAIQSNVTCLVSSKTIVQLDNSDVIPTRACLSENLVCQALRHLVTNGFDRAASSERVGVVCPEPRRDELDGLVLKLIVMHERLICKYTARSSILCRDSQHTMRG